MAKCFHLPLPSSCRIVQSDLDEEIDICRNRMDLGNFSGLWGHSWSSSSLRSSILQSESADENNVHDFTNNVNTGFYIDFITVFVFSFISFYEQNDIIEWARDHRVHHKFTDTNADPHNSTRGFFFSHIGWLMCKKHPDVRKFGAKVDMSDVESDPVCQFQRK